MKTNPFNYKALSVQPTLCLCKGGGIYNHLVNMLAAKIKTNQELYKAFCRLCKDKDRKPDEYLPEYAASCIDSGAENTSFDNIDGKEAFFGDYRFEYGLFAAEVNLLGLPNVTEVIKERIMPSLNIVADYYVVDGLLHCTVELSGKPSEVAKNTPELRKVLRMYGFGDIETSIEAATEDDGILTVPTFASRTLP